MWNFPYMSNEITKSCEGSLCYGQDMKQAPARCIAWSGLFDAFPCVMYLGLFWSPRIRLFTAVFCLLPPVDYCIIFDGQTH